MSQDAAVRARWRDALVLLVLAGVLVAGLVHYGRGFSDDGAATTSATPGDTPAATPSAEETAQLESAPPTDPATPAQPHGGTCWDGRATTSLRLCGLPEGARGLAWVFPSFARDRDACHRIEPRSDSYPTVASYECFQRALGQSLAIVYEQIDDPAAVHQWLVRWLGADRVRAVAGPNGGRWIAKDGRTQPTRIAGLYQRFPYVVSVFADSRLAAARAWKVLVEMRPEDQIRGIRRG